MPGVRGFADPTAIKLASTGESVFYPPYRANPLGYLLPFHVNTQTTSAESLPDTDHSWGTQHQAWDGGKMDQWLPGKGPWTMTYYERQDIPFHWALAESFTILDNYHCAVLGPTTPNRMMWLTGTSDPNGENGRPILETVTSGHFNWPTYAEALTEAGVSWKFYNDPQGNPYMNTLTYAAPGSVLYESGVAPAATGQFEFDIPALGAPWLSAKLDTIASD